MDGKRYPKESQQLAELAKVDNRIILIDALFNQQEIWGIMSVCDSFISLHRSEGIGLGMAQSMLLGKPVIATNYSGNEDFTLAECSCPVDYQIIAVEKDEYPFWQGQRWADPNLEHAAYYMKKLVEEESYRKKIALAGQALIQNNHSPARIGGLYRSRLQELGLWKT